MRKKKIILMFICFTLFTGCFGNKDVSKKFINKIEKTKSYYLTGTLEILNNEDIYKYDVNVSYKKEDLYKVSLKNKMNDHEQIILRNEDGVFVLTPSLNKSFKFQSDWPYNNSQSYLLQSIADDIKKDKKKKVKSTDKEIIIETKVNYSNNKKLILQKIYFDKNSNLKKVEVYDKDLNVSIRMKFKNIDLKSKFKKDYFKISESIKTDKTLKTSNEITDITYPMYMPANTYLASEDKINISDGERVILTFLGEKPFTIIEETVNVSKEIETLNMNGEPELLIDTIGSLSDKSVSWISNGVSYYATSDSLNENELLEVVRSINTIPVSK